MFGIGEYNREGLNAQLVLGGSLLMKGFDKNCFEQNDLYMQFKKKKKTVYQAVVVI